MNTVDARACWKPLHEVPSAHEGNNTAYLQKNDIDLYYQDNPEISKQYFESGNV